MIQMYFVAKNKAIIPATTNKNPISENHLSKQFKAMASCPFLWPVKVMVIIRNKSRKIKDNGTGYMESR
jgi:hypothetical protein